MQVFYAVVCWGNKIKPLTKTAGQVCVSGGGLGFICGCAGGGKFEEHVENHPREQNAPAARDPALQRSSRSERIISLRCVTERFRVSFILAEIRFHNRHCGQRMLF